MHRPITYFHNNISAMHLVNATKPFNNPCSIPADSASAERRTYTYGKALAPARPPNFFRGP